jgi:hypothetical protein
MAKARQSKFGTPLNLAWIKFAPAPLRRQYRAYKPGDIYGQPPPPGSFADGDRKAAFAALLKIPGQFLELTGRIEPPVAEEMRRAVFAKVAGDKFCAFGIPVEPTPGLDPVPIPASLLRWEFFQWHKSAIHGGGFSFREVTLAKPDKVSGNEIAAAVARKENAVPRRLENANRRKEAILTEWQKLDGENEGRFRTDTWMANAIRGRLGKPESKVFAKGKGLSHNNILKIVKSATLRP